jgi:hypothetical protein
MLQIINFVCYWPEKFCTSIKNWYFCIGSMSKLGIFQVNDIYLKQENIFRIQKAQARGCYLKRTLTD